MSAYVPEFVYGFTGWDEYNQPIHGLVEWPAHLTPREASGIELTKKGQSYVAAAMAEADGVFFLTIDSRDRQSIATTIERLIAVLDELDPDPDLEATGDDEPSLGWPEEHGLSQLDFHGKHGPLDDDREDENEYGGDINDEPQDDSDSGDAEPFLGRLETIHQGGGSYMGQSIEQADQLLDFNGDGKLIGRDLVTKARVRQIIQRAGGVS